MISINASKYVEMFYKYDIFGVHAIRCLMLKNVELAVGGWVLRNANTTNCHIILNTIFLIVLYYIEGTLVSNFNECFVVVIASFNYIYSPHVLCKC